MKKRTYPAEILAICEAFEISPGEARVMVAIARGQTATDIGWTKTLFRQQIYNLRRRLGPNVVRTVPLYSGVYKHGVPVKGYDLDSEVREKLATIL